MAVSFLNPTTLLLVEHRLLDRVGRHVLEFLDHLLGT